MLRIKEITQAHKCHMVQEDMQFIVLYHDVAATHKTLGEYI